jgi:hypothetical protein
MSRLHHAQPPYCESLTSARSVDRFSTLTLYPAVRFLWPRDGSSIDRGFHLVYITETACVLQQRLSSSVTIPSVWDSRHGQATENLRLRILRNDSGDLPIAQYPWKRYSMSKRISSNISQFLSCSRNIHFALNLKPYYPNHPIFHSAL